MDPTLRRIVTGALQAIDSAHQGEPTCSCGSATPEGRDRHLLDEIAGVFAETYSAPHVVHVDPEYADETIRTYDPARAFGERPPDGFTDVDGDGDPDPYWEYVETGRVNVPTDCPDCTRGLVSRGVDQICITLPTTLELGGATGDVIACGLNRG